MESTKINELIFEKLIELAVEVDKFYEDNPDQEDMINQEFASKLVKKGNSDKVNRLSLIYNYKRL